MKFGPQSGQNWLFGPIEYFFWKKHLSEFDLLIVPYPARFEKILYCRKFMDTHIDKLNPPHVFGLKKRGLMNVFFFQCNIYLQ